MFINSFFYGLNIYRKMNRFDLTLGGLFVVLIFSVLGNRAYNKMIQDNYNVNKTESEIMQQVLINETQLAKTHKPILWVHLPFEKNSRNWDSFYSRNNNELNQPYLYLTVKSIVDNNYNDFHICLIDDNSFGKLLPDWFINMNFLGENEKKKYRILGILKLIYRYGGMNVPVSTLCFDSIKSLYKDEPFTYETVSNSILSETVLLTPNYHFFGSPKENTTVKDLIYKYETCIQNSNDDIYFNGKFEQLCFEKIQNHELQLLSGKYIGTKSEDDKEITIDTLMNISNDYSLSYLSSCLYIPNEELLKRSNYSWFCVEKTDNIVKGNYMLGHQFGKIYDI